MVWARTEEGTVRGFLVEQDAPGYRGETIRGKASLRAIHQAHITLTDVRIRGFFGAGFEVLVRHGTLVLRLLSPVPVLYRGFPLHPDDEDDPYLFRVDLTAYDLGSIQVAFTPDDAGSVTLNLAAPMPLSAERRSAASNPRLWTQRAAVATATSVAATVLATRALQVRPHRTG